MNREHLTIALLVLAALATVGCRATTPPPSPAPASATPAVTPTFQATPEETASPTPAARIPLLITATMTERCGYIGGCAAYLDIRPASGEEWSRIPLLGPADALPTSLAPGTYTFEFIWRGRSDDIAVGEPAQEFPLDTCSVEVGPPELGGRDTVSVQVTATFHGATCEAEAAYRVAIVN